MAKIILLANQVAIREWPLDKERLSIGRARSNDIHLDDPAVSSHHAAICLIAGAAFVEDLGSTNGTLLNDAPVQRALLRNRDEVTVAPFHLRYEESLADEGLEQTVVLSASALPTPAERPVEVATSDPGRPVRRPGPTRGPRARLQLLSGRQVGRSMELVKPLTTLGRPGVQVAAIRRLQTGYTLHYVPTAGDGGAPPKVNGKTMGAGPYVLQDNDVIELAGITLGFFASDATA
ncbi:MAG TPA: FHA domain-containing protein [Candidatus Macondimonas sp.]|nr:FHA domain-containing protein [Candidatus Macondimonas sp.]